MSRVVNETIEIKEKEVCSLKTEVCILCCYYEISCNHVTNCIIRIGGGIEGEVV